MATITQGTDLYLSHFARLEQELAGKGPASRLPLRREAMARFAELGFPTTKHEEWKYTSVAPIARMSFQPAGPVTHVEGRGWEGLAAGDSLRGGPLPFGQIAGCRLVFIN